MTPQEQSHQMWLDCNEAKGPDEQVCCVYKGEQPLYFVMAADASDEEIDLRSFQVRNDRPMTDAELTLRSLHKHRMFLPLDPWGSVADAH